MRSLKYSAVSRSVQPRNMVVSHAPRISCHSSSGYESDYFRFQVSGFDVLVKNELLAEALNALPEKKRDIVLLSYFLDMSDAEIGDLLNVVRTTVFRHRKTALAKIKQYMEGKADDEHR